MLSLPKRGKDNQFTGVFMSNDEVRISLSITPAWSILKEIQEKTETFLKKKDTNQHIVEATIMCASELVENAIKYGYSSDLNSNITFDMSMDADRVIIKVSNGIKDNEDLKKVKTHIERLKETNDPGKLYTERLMQLMENPKPGVSQLGLYRIAYEGDFKLDYIYENGLLTIIASRRYIN
jgi:hypothetical protein